VVEVWSTGLSISSVLVEDYETGMNAAPVMVQSCERVMMIGYYLLTYCWTAMYTFCGSL